MWRGLTSCVFGILVLLLPRISSAADPNDFLAGLYTELGTGLELPYRLFAPLDYDPANEYPLVLFLHGAGESGTDNEAQVNRNIDNLLAHVKMPQYSSFLLAPQTNSGWSNWSSADPSDAVRMSLSVIDQVETEYNIDSSQLFITGLSMGGFGTWDTIWKRPGTFAAAVPICGGGDTSKAPLMVDQPVWNFHNADDGTVPVGYSRDMIAAVQAAGGNPFYTEYSSGGHNSWSRAYNESAMYDWMFSQPVVTEPGVLSTNPLDGGAIDFGLVRIGATGTTSVTATNTGAAGSELVGNFPAAGGEFGPGSSAVFGPVASGEVHNRQYTYDPSDHGPDTRAITVDSTGGDSTITLSGTGVGPVFESGLAPGSTLDFDTVQPEVTESLFLDVSNLTTDSDGGDNTLTDLTLLDVQITGQDPEMFDVVGFSSPTVLSRDGMLSVQISYNGSGSSYPYDGSEDWTTKSASLTIVTDQGAALGLDGESFDYQISAELTPLPGTLTTNPADGTTLDLGLVRVGTTGIETLTVTNTGDLDTGLYGALPTADGEFALDGSPWFGPLDSGADSSRQYTHTPMDRGLDTLPVTVTSNGGDSTFTLSGTGVGPVFQSSLAPGSLLDLDTVEPGVPESLFLDLSNITTDAHGGDATLTDLTLLGVVITGEDADLFDVSGFVPGTVLHKDDIFNLELSYDGTAAPGLKNATLTILTDEDAAVGGDGLDFSYDIFANVLGNTSGSGVLEADGSILLTLDSVNFYKVFIGDQLGNETFDFTDLLHYDAGNTAPNWICWAASLQDHVDDTVQGDENFAEIISSGNWIGTPTFPATDFDTGINVDALPAGYKLWLKYGFLGEEPTLVSIDVSAIPEPSTLTLLGMCALGLLACAWRKCRHV